MNSKTKKRSCNIDKKTLKKIRSTLNPKQPIKNFHNIVYNSPLKDDMAIGLVYFNCVGSKRLLMNYLYTVEKLKLAKIPYYTIEMYVDKIDIADAIHVKTELILFQKERLCYLLEKHIPQKYKKLLFMDTDMVYENINWYNDVSKKLDDFNIVQCYSNIYYLDITYKKIDKSFYSSSLIRNRKDNSSHFGSRGGASVFGTPGGAWAFQRQWFNDIGFFQYDPLGSCDKLSVLIWYGIDTEYRYNSSMTTMVKGALAEYKAKLKQLPSICFVEGLAYHLWHGTLENRQYIERKEIFKSVKDIRDILKIGENGLFELVDKTKYKSKIMKYFKNKDDDGI